MLGDLFPRALHRGRWNRACHGFPLDLEGQGPIGAVAGRAFGFAAATRLAALLEAASQRAGAQVAEGGEFLLDPVTPEGERIKGIGDRHGDLLSSSI